MIATRKKRMHFPIQRYLKMLLFVGVVYEIYSVPFSHKLVFDGPLKPFWKQVSESEKKMIQPYLGPVVDPIIKPLRIMALRRQLYERAHTISVVKAQLASAQAEIKAKNATLASNAKRIAALEHAGPSGKAVSPSLTGNSAPATAASPTPDELKTASYWASMEPQNAAQIVQKLPPLESARIFLAMKPEQVAEIMNLLPTAYNVKLKEVHVLSMNST